jgi:hypothetical protein
MLTPEASSTLPPATSPATPSATSSPAFQGGQKPLDSPDGPQTAPSGPAPALVSPSPQQVATPAPPTPATCGPSSAVSSRSAALQSYLANRLQAPSTTAGSTSSPATWKPKTTPSGRPYLAHTPSALRTAVPGSTGQEWPTPQANKLTKNSTNPTRMKEGGVQTALADAAWLAAPWTTPQAHDTHPRGSGNRQNPNAGGACLGWDAKAAQWATPNTRDHKDTGNLEPSMTRQDGLARLDTVPRQAWTATSGAEGSGSPAPTANRGALNPALSRWLMGFAASWDSAALRAHRSYQKSRPTTPKTRVKPASSASAATATPSSPSAAPFSSVPSGSSEA